MPATAAVLRELARAGLSADEMVEAAERIENAERSRSSTERVRAFRVRRRETRNVKRAAVSSPPDKETPQTPQEINPQYSPPSGARTARVREDGFDRFWEIWPHKVGKAAARKSWPRALKAAGTIEVVLAGVQRYIADKPPDRQWLNPATFLNQQRWSDAPAMVATGPPNGNRAVTFSDIRREAERRLAESDEPATAIHPALPDRR